MLRMHIYCSGIGGIGLSGYAALQNALGHTVSGSDRSKSPLTKDLQKQGISVCDIQDGSHVTAGIDLFVYSEAIPEDAPERSRARELGIPQLSYFAALGELSKDYRTIAVCGTHGKSSTTAMAAKALLDAGLDPTVIVGTKVPQLSGRNWRKGASDIFLLEACEYRGSFLHLHPDIILMTNVELDHVDAYSSLEEYRNAYRDFIGRLSDGGVVITHMSDPDCMDTIANMEVEVLDADQTPFPQLSVPGRHMQENAQLVVALGNVLGFDTADSLYEFSGTWRRMEIKGDTENGATVIDDYAHHPREIAATIAAARQGFPGRRIVCLFQPHMHNRLLRFYNDFCISFDGADLVVTTDVYDARADVDTEKADIKQFTADIHAESVYGGSLESAKNLLCSTILQQNDVVLVLGAGDVTTVAQQLVR